MKVPFVNYGKNYRKIKKEIDKAIKKCLENGDLILRDEVEKFEKRFAEICGAKYCLALNSGTDAIFLSLKALGIGEEDEVITTWHTYEGVIEAIKRCGAKPVLIGIRNDFTIDVDKIEWYITSRTKAIIPVHINGKVCEMRKIKKIAIEKNLFVIEDSCQAIGKKLEGHLGCYSFYPAKILGCYGDGGALVTNDWFLYERAKKLRDEGYINSRLDNIQAAILNVKLKYLKFYLKRRKEIAERYTNGLKGISGIQLPQSDFWQNYVVKVVSYRDKLREFLKENGIETMVKGYKYDYPWLKDIVLSLPLYPELTNKQIDYVIQKVKEFFQKQKGSDNRSGGVDWKPSDSAIVSSYPEYKIIYS